jgi:hypothetical protein
MAGGEMETFAPPSRTAGADLSADPLTTEELLELETLGEDAEELAAVSAEFEQVQGELELALKQRELLRSIEEAVQQLPLEEQAEMLAHVATILQPKEEFEAKRDKKDSEFAAELMEILADPVPLGPEEQAQLRPMAAHALNTARGDVAVALVFEKIPALFDDAVAKEVKLSNTEIVALATATSDLAMEVASRPSLLARLSALELMALLCDVDQRCAEAICAEAPHLEELQPEHLAIFKDKNPKVADAVFKLAHVRKRLGPALEACEEHWKRVAILNA